MRILINPGMIVAIALAPLTSSGQTLQGDANRLQLIGATMIQVPETDVRISQIDGLEWTEPGLFLISDWKSGHAFVTDPAKSTTRRIGGRGQAPGEYTRAMAVQADGERLYVRDGGAARTLSFDLRSGRYLGTPASIPWAYRYWIVDGRHELLYLTPFREGYLAVRDRESGEIIRQWGVGGSENDALMLYGGSGGLALLNGSILAASPARPEFHVIDPSTWRHRTIIIPDRDFRVAPARAGLESDWPAHVDYINANSRVCGIFAMDKYIVVQVEHGQDVDSRWLRWHIFDHDFRHLDSVTMNAEYRYDNGLAFTRILTTDGTHLFIPTTRTTSLGDFRWVLWGWQVEPVRPSGPAGRGG
jgi:hypothetical protein